MPVRSDEAAWKRDCALVRATRLEVAAGNREWTFGETILGAARHEAYHTGQIRLLKRLWVSNE